jgi:16S rRNA C1402 (ribose-2'-O) methylase RsmI
MESFWRWRWLLAGLGLVLAVVLIAAGNVVVGVLVGAMAIVRIVMFSKLQRRRAQFAGARRRRF